MRLSCYQFVAPEREMGKDVGWDPSQSLKNSGTLTSLMPALEMQYCPASIALSFSFREGT